MSKGKIALLIILLLFSSFTFSSNRNIDENNNSQLLDIVPAGSYIGDFTHQEAVGTTIHSGLDIFPSNVDLGYQFTITENPDGSYSSPENIILRDVTAAYDGYVVAHKSYDNIHDLNTSMYGNFYLIKHPKAGVNNVDLYTLYLHLANPILVNDSRRIPKLGEYVKKGDFLGIMYKGGTSANGYIHLHYAIQTFSNLAETSWIGAIYSSPSKSIGDYIVTINGVETTNNEFYNLVYRNPEQYIFSDNINYIDNSAFSLIKKLRETNYVNYSNITNTIECNSFLNNLSKSIPSNHIFESNFSALYLDTTDENSDQISLCLFKDVQRELIVRYDINSQQTFIYDKNIDAGYSYSTHQFYGLYDTALELYDFWNSKTGNVSNILNNSINIINSNLSTYKAGNLENCIIDWNSWNIEYYLSSNLDLNLHVTDYENNCVIYDRFNTAFLMFNKNSEIYEYSSDLNKYLEIRKYVVNQKTILEEVLNDINLLNGLTRSVSNTADCMALWNDGGSERLVHTENKSYEAKFYGDSCLYFRENSFIIDYDLETRTASKLYYDTVSNSKYREYMTFRHFVNNLKSAKADETWRNGYGLTLNSSGNVGCTIADNCPNGEITTAQQCENMFTALTGVNISDLQFEVSYSSNYCKFENSIDSKSIYYGLYSGDLKIYSNFDYMLDKFRLAVRSIREGEHYNYGENECKNLLNTVGFNSYYQNYSVSKTNRFNALCEVSITDTGEYYEFGFIYYTFDDIWAPAHILNYCDGNNNCSDILWN